ncbi:MAG: rhomboid family intramembrane serine protease, partial [Tenuifilaceae bacterium]
MIYNLVKVFLFLGGSAFHTELTRFLAVPAYLPNLAHRPWTVFTYMFFHEGFIHILFNLLWLYWLGRIFLNFMSERKLFGVY